MTLLNELPGVARGKKCSAHKEPLRDCRLGTRLAVVLLPFSGMTEGGCCLVPSEWKDYLGIIGDRSFIIVILHFLHSVGVYLFLLT